MNFSSSRFKTIVAVCGVSFVMLSYYAYQIFFTPNILMDDNRKEFVLYIPKGATYKTVLDTLYKNEVLADKVSFSFISKLLGYQEAVKPGRYILPAKSTNMQVVRKLRSGNQDAVKLTFNSIRLKEDFADRVGSKFQFGSDSLWWVLNDPKVCAKYGMDTTTILCLFLPNTYEIYWDSSTDQFLERMQTEHSRFWNVARIEKAQKAGLTPIQATILASIVEAETNMNSEKATIAGVYINRLNINMPLQADPTVKYALRDFDIKRINHDLIEKAGSSPYNTYRVNGLPPGPINMPSVISIKAVLDYESHNYLFFVADKNKPGYHIFNEDYRAHVNQANKYRKNLNQKNIH
ncbi:MAG: endolytic transglycosylase MltG [Cytophagaceae bacterium]